MTDDRPPMTHPSEEFMIEQHLIDRREAIRRVTVMLGGIALVGGDALLTGCRDDRAGRTAASGNAGEFTPEEIAYLDEIADTILPTTSTPGAKAAKVGPFMALMVRDSYHAPDQKIFRAGMKTLDEECRKANNASFMEATPQQRLALLKRIDQEQKQYMDARGQLQQRQAMKGFERARTSGMPGTSPPDSAQGDRYDPGQRQENATGSGANPAPGITADAPAHYFRMMKELALLGYFTSEIGYTQAMRYRETPGRFDPCVPYTKGEKAWAPHA
jgi:hypothetical protein